VGGTGWKRPSLGLPQACARPSHSMRVYEDAPASRTQAVGRTPRGDGRPTIPALVWVRSTSRSLFAIAAGEVDRFSLEAAALVSGTSLPVFGLPASAIWLRELPRGHRAGWRPYEELLPGRADSESRKKSLSLRVLSQEGRPPLLRRRDYAGAQGRSHRESSCRGGYTPSRRAERLLWAASLIRSDESLFVWTALGG